MPRRASQGRRIRVREAPRAGGRESEEVGELVGGSADEEAVCRNLEEAFERYGAPLVLKQDGGSIVGLDLESAA